MFEQREQNHREDREDYEDDKTFDDGIRLEVGLAPGCCDHIGRLNWILAEVEYHGRERLAT